MANSRLRGRREGRGHDQPAQRAGDQRGPEQVQRPSVHALQGKAELIPGTSRADFVHEQITTIDLAHVPCGFGMVHSPRHAASNNALPHRRPSTTFGRISGVLYTGIMKTDQPALQVMLVLGHGSRRGLATDNGIREIARRLQQRFPGGPPIRPAFFEFLSPTLPEAVRQAARQGAREIAVLPYFLFDGKEIKRDIPGELDRLRTELPRVAIRQMPNLGLDPRLARLVAQRVREALDGASQYLPAHGLVRRCATGRLGVVLVNRGSKIEWDPGTRLEALGDLVRQELGGDTLIATAQAENSDRTIEVAADQLAAQGAKRVVVAPYLHFVGKVLAQNVVPALERSRASYPGIQFCLAWTLCVNGTAIDILADRACGTGFIGVENRQIPADHHAGVAAD